MIRKYLKELQSLQLKALKQGVNIDLQVRDAGAILPWVSVGVTKEGWYEQPKDENGNTPGYFSTSVSFTSGLSREDNEAIANRRMEEIKAKIEEFSTLVFKKEGSNV